MRIQISLLSILVMAAFIPLWIERGHATGTLYVDPVGSPVQSVNSTFVVQIKVAGLGLFSGWDVYVKSNTSAINPMSIDTSANLFTQNFKSSINVAANCVSNVGLGCQSVDGPGIAHSSASVTGSIPPDANTDGLLFTVKYNVTSAGVYSPINLFNDVLANPNPPYSVDHLTQSGFYGTPPPDFQMNTDSRFLTITAGSNYTTRIWFNSTLGFGGQLKLTLEGNNFGVHGGVNVTMPRSNLLLATGGSNITTLTFVTSNSTVLTGYQLNVTATSGTIQHFLLINVAVKLPQFIMIPSPSLLQIHAPGSAASIVTVQSLFGFSGNITLSVDHPPNVTATLSATLLSLPAGATAQSTLTITVPASALAFRYIISVIATGGYQTPVERQIIVTPPPASFAVNIGAGSLNLQPGKAANMTITISSVDYLLGFIYIGAVMDGGAATLNTTRIFLNIGATASIGINVTTSRNTPPGNYVLLLTVYQPGSSAQQIPVTVAIFNPYHSSGRPSVTILGLSPLVYFSILGAFAVMFVGLGVYAYRRRELD